MDALCILYRQPVPGQGKSRLRDSLRASLADHGEAEKTADLLYLAFLMDLRERIETFSGTVMPFVAGIARNEAFWPGSRPQKGSTLGLRMSAALEAAFSRGADRALLIGGDAPWLDASFLHRCLTELDHTGAILGPSNDGGYYLIGFRVADYKPSVFELSAWGHERVLEQTRELLKKAEVTVKEAELGIDFDEVNDLRRYFSCPGAADTLPHTWAIYQSLTWRNDNES